MSIMLSEEIYERVLAILKSTAKHRYCEDGYYGCPKNVDSFGHYEYDKCDCWGDEAEQILKDLGDGELDAEPMTNTTEIGGGYVAAEMTRPDGLK